MAYQVKPELRRRMSRILAPLALSLVCSGGALAANDLPIEPARTQNETAREAASAAAGAGAETDLVGKNAPQHLTREGLKIQFDVTPVASSLATGQLTETDTAEVRFTITDAQSGEPVSGLYPTAWMDVAEAFDQLHGKGGQTMSCRDRVGIYLQGIVGVRPLIDLNSYFVMVLNQDPSITVIDPILGVQGRTNMYAQVILKRAGADWAKEDDEKRMFVSMPAADMVAVVDLGKFAVSHNIEAGDNPQRVVLQHDEQYLWVGNDSTKEGQSGVTVINAQTLEPVKFIATGAGHHEITLASNDKYAFITNRDSGTVTVVEVANLEKVKEINVGTPIALGYNDLSEALYVADSDSGDIWVVDGETLETRTRIETAPGLGPMRFSTDGRWVFAVNPHTDQVFVVDASNNSVEHRIPMEGRPFSLSVSDSFAYIRSLENEYVRMINVKELGRRDTPLITKFAAGKAAPGKARNLPIADLMVPAPGEASMLVASPADLTVYYYMEGMNAPMGNFRNYGHLPRAVNVVDRTLKERKPGEYSAKVKIPAAGNYDVVFLLDSPRMLHCFEATAAINPHLEKNLPPLAIEYLTEGRKVDQGASSKVRFKLVDPKTQQPLADLQDVKVLYYNTSGRQRETVLAKAVGEGIYEADVTPRYAGAYYLWVSAPSMGVDSKQLEYFSLMSVPSSNGSVAPVGANARGG